MFVDRGTWYVVRGSWLVDRGSWLGGWGHEQRTTYHEPRLLDDRGDADAELGEDLGPVFEFLGPTEALEQFRHDDGVVRHQLRTAESARQPAARQPAGL